MASVPLVAIPTKVITISVAAHLVRHIDSQAAYYGMSRVAYLRLLMVRDAERCSRTTADQRLDQPAA